MPFAALITRLIGLWLFFGAMMKLFYGTPADLPLVGPDLPLDTALLLFKVVIGIEVIAGALVLLRPSRGWLPAAGLLAAFLVVLVLQVVRGEEACGCFGTAVTITPQIMLAIDGSLFLLLLLSKPWRLAQGRLELPWIAVAVVALAGIVLTVAIDCRAESDNFVDLEIPASAGKRLADTPVYRWLSEEQRIENGLIVIWSRSCGVCAQHLFELAGREGERDLVLLELPKKDEDEPDLVEVLPEGAWVQEARLPEGYEWWITAPGHIEVKDGKVVVAVEGMDVLDLPKPPK